jgi:hypothetical protein
MGARPAMRRSTAARMATLATMYPSARSRKASRSMGWASPRGLGMSRQKMIERAPASRAAGWE